MKFTLEILAVAGLTALATAAIPDDPTVLINENARQMNQSLLWGVYRPNLYFGVRPRIAKSFMGGLMWAKVENYNDIQNSMSFLPQSIGVG